MYGGIGTVAGAVIGALSFGVLNIGMGVMSIPIDDQFAIKALVLLGAVFFDVSSKGRGFLSRRRRGAVSRRHGSSQGRGDV
jgi:putative multiple sugar transport system permease protein